MIHPLYSPDWHGVNDFVADLEPSEVARYITHLRELRAIFPKKEEHDRTFLLETAVSMMHTFCMQYTHAASALITHGQLDIPHHGTYCLTLFPSRTFRLLFIPLSSPECHSPVETVSLPPNTLLWKCVAAHLAAQPPRLDTIL